MSWFKKLLGISSVNEETQSTPITNVEHKPAQKQNFSKDVERQKAFVDVERHEKTYYATSTPRSIKGQITRLKNKVNSSGVYLNDEKDHFQRRIRQLENLLLGETKQETDAVIQAKSLKEKRLTDPT